MITNHTLLIAGSQREYIYKITIQKNTQIRFHSKRPHTISKISMFPYTSMCVEFLCYCFINQHVQPLYYLWIRNCLPFRSTWVHPRFEWGSCYSVFSFMCMFCKSFFVFWPLCCLFFFDLRILITSLVSSNSSYVYLCPIFAY